MLVWPEGQCGTIGGGRLEFDLTAQARARLEPGHFSITRNALGPDMGQCCGGSVDIVTEVFDEATAQALPHDLVIRGRGDEPLAVTRLRRRARNSGVMPQAQLLAGWMVEPVSMPSRPIWIWGAGHVGRALVATLAPLPDMAITWLDTDAARFPRDIPAGVTLVPAADLARLASRAPLHANHLVLTYSHALDLELCHALLKHGFGEAGLIGSSTKWARFRKRLSELGHGAQAIDRITCPIGRPEFGKHPQQIAIGVASEIMCSTLPQTRLKEYRA
jgi:xanthine dehydrogenase accessory factor